MDDERKRLENEIERLKKDLEVYLRVFPMLGVSEAEKNRVINQILDDILIRQKKLESG
ncbi:MAG: hypothetical protein AB2L24_33045 [Mangrovibacterium sp.]